MNNLQEYAELLTPLFQKLGEVRMEVNPTGKSLRVHAGDKQVFWHLAKGALKGAKLDENAFVLTAGPAVLQRAWERLRPVAPELVEELKTVARNFGLAVELDTEDGRTVYLEGEWLIEEGEREKTHNEYAHTRCGMGGFFLKDYLRLKRVAKSKGRYYVRSEENVKETIRFLGMLVRDGVRSAYY